jgi:hypothetical protein
VLKSDAKTGSGESYWYCEVGLSQLACTILSETSSCLNCLNVGGARSNKALSYKLKGHGFETR